MDWASLAGALIHTHVVLITGAYADTHTHTPTHTLLDSQCLIFRVVTADDTQRTMKRRTIEKEKGGRDGCE